MTVDSETLRELVVASNNDGKIREYRDLLEPLGFRVISQREKGLALDVEETGVTFEENAVLKAEAVHAATHGWVISDDSGLQVDALGGEPGIYSARYRGLATEHERRMAVLAGLEGAENRAARFVCCICLMKPDGERRLFTGVWEGTIALREEGVNGFGYDPIFVAAESGGHTTASLPITFKETWSHRARAVRQLREALLRDENGK